MKEFAELASALASILSTLAWPVVAGVCLVMMRSKVTDLVDVAIEKVRASTELQFGNVKLTGIDIQDKQNILKDGSDLSIILATSEDHAERDKIYESLHGMMLVHTIKPTIPPEYHESKLIFHVSVYLKPHRDASINSVKQVTYYFGRHWGKGDFGSKFQISNGNNFFAIRASMYGTMLCVAEIEFHDGSSGRAYRYIDIETAALY